MIQKSSRRHYSSCIFSAQTLTVPESNKQNIFFIFNIKVYNIIDHTTYELLYDTTNTVPGGAIYHDYPLAFNTNLRNTTHTTTTK